jgi:hypothetical protein
MEFTVIPSNLIPMVQAIIGWLWVIVFLTVGPAIGIPAMARLRQDVSSYRLAYGKRW